MDVESTAFVAMKFNGDPWNDKKYLIISEVLKEAGYHPVRADEIPSSGAAMDEVVEFLRKSVIVVVDASGDSHNVSYELGFCHGIGRSPNDVILLSEHGKSLPFNYAHFRHHPYDDLRHLRALLRYRLSISTPLTDDQLGHAFCFMGGEDEIYGSEVAEAVVSALKSLSFSGRCEYYAGNTNFSVSNQYVVGLGIKPADRKQRATGRWFDQLKKLIVAALRDQGSKTTFERHLSGAAEMRALRHDLMSRGAAEFTNGRVVRLLDAENQDSWFAGVVLEDLRNSQD